MDVEAEKMRHTLKKKSDNKSDSIVEDSISTSSIKNIGELKGACKLNAH